MKILLVGGGSGGSVSPLLAVADKIKSKKPGVEFLFVGGKNGPENNMAEKAGIPFVSITAGKFRRYFTLVNIVAPLFVIMGFFQSKKIIKQFHPDVVFGTGSFIQVPLIWATIGTKIPVVIHQQDVLPSLANKLCSWVASRITVTFSKSALDFSSGFGLSHKNTQEKIVVTGNPFRQELKMATRQQAIESFRLHNELPVLLVTGGGTGATALNNIIWQSLPSLTKIVQVIHQTGKGKNTYKGLNTNYHAYEFIENMGEAYATADVVLCRAGISTITELSNLEKLAIIVPMPGTHQELNAKLIEEASAGFVAEQKDLNAVTLPHLVRQLLFRYKMQQGIKEIIKNIMPHDAAENIAGIILKLIDDR